MNKNITLSADEALIHRSRQKAQQENTTLNELFRQWLKQYVGQNHSSLDFRELMAELEYAKAGRKFTRDDLNER